MKKTSQKALLLFALVTTAITSSASAGQRLGEHEQLAKEIEEDISIAMVTFYNDVRWFRNGRMFGADKEFYSHLDETKKSMIQISDQLRHRSHPRSLEHQFRVTRESFECLNEFANRMNLSRKTQTFLNSATENFFELEECIAPRRSNHHHHSQVQPKSRDTREFSNHSRSRESERMDPREMIARSIFDRFASRN